MAMNTLKRLSIVGIVCSAMLVAGCASLVDLVGGASSRDPAAMSGTLSPAARELLERAYADVEPAKLLDYHVHLLGMGEGASGCYVNERMLSWAHPTDRARFLVYRSAARITDERRVESQYLERLDALARPQGGRFLLLAFDEHHDARGNAVRAKTEFHVPDDYAMATAAGNPERFVAACSIHPGSSDAIARLERCAASGIRVVKWLPSAMGIDPADEHHRPFYERMRSLDMVLLSHGGKEAAVEADESQHLSNPLRLRLPLDAGVKVIVAHFASLGEDADLEDPARRSLPSWRILLRMMDEPRWRGLLFADISAITQANRTPEPLATLLRRQDLHARLVNGSDYPLPAVNILIRTSSLVAQGFITPAERTALNEIYDFNPLMFDYVLKRTLSVRDADGKAHRFSPRIFEQHPELAPTRD
jgi:predicted TIM-barrel fold metal-dependent hydrolase